MREPKQSDSPSGYDREVQPRRRSGVYYPPGLQDPNWQFEGDAFEQVHATLTKTDRDRKDCGLPALMDADLTVAQRINGIGAVLKGPQSPETVAAAGAQLVALLAWMLRADDARPELGTAA